MGVHNPDAALSEPSDPVDSPSATKPGTAAIPLSPVNSSSAAETAAASPHVLGVSPITVEDQPAAGGDEASMKDDENGEQAGQDLWDYLFGKLEGIKEWVGNLVNGVQEQDA